MARNQWKLAHIWNAMSIRTFGFLFTNRPDYIVVTTGVDKSMQKNFIERVANVHRKNQTNATCVIIHLLMQAIWGHIWKCTVEKSQTNATNAIMLLLQQAIWGHIWKHTVEKRQTNATNATLHPFRQAIWGHIWKCTVEKNQTNATNATMQPFRQAIWGDIWKHTVDKADILRQLDCKF